MLKIYTLSVALLALTSSRICAQIAPDHSWPVATYVEYFALPHPDSIWEQRELKRLTKYLSQLAEGNRWELPRHQSPHSGDLFARMCDARRLLAPTYNPAAPLDERIAYHNELGQYMGTMLQCYGDPLDEPQTMAAEQLRLLALSWEVSVGTEQLLAELLARIPAHSPDRAPVEAIQRDTREAFMDLNLRLIDLLMTQYAHYPEAELRGFAAKWSERLPALLTHLEEGQAAQVWARADALKGHPDREIQKAFRRMLSVAADGDSPKGR